MKEKLKNFFTHKEVIETLKLIALLVTLYLVVTLAFTYVPFLNKYKIYAIQTNSMEPIIFPGDLVIVEEKDPTEIMVGDITAFHIDITNDGEDDVIVHYIDEIIQHTEDELVYRSKAEISDIQDSWTIEEQDIIGVYVRNVGGIGKVLLFLQSWVGKVVLLVDIIIISVIYDALFKKKDKNQVKTKIKKSTSD